MLSLLTSGYVPFPRKTNSTEHSPSLVLLTNNPASHQQAGDRRESQSWLAQARAAPAQQCYGAALVLKAAQGHPDPEVSAGAVAAGKGGAKRENKHFPQGRNAPQAQTAWEQLAQKPVPTGDPAAAPRTVPLWAFTAPAAH